VSDGRASWCISHAARSATNHYLDNRGIRITTGTIVDATIIHAPSSTKNRIGRRAFGLYIGGQCA
jgi:hypothetical protein